MRETAPGLLWIGNAFDARDVCNVLAQRIEAVVDLAIEEPPIALPRELIYCRFPLVDGRGNSRAIIQLAINTAVTLVTAQVPTLISCGAGMSRSPAIAAGVLARLNRIEPDESLKLIASSGPHDIAPLLWQDIKAVLKGGMDPN